MNEIILMGRLTRDPEMRVSQGNEPISIGRFGIAVDRARKKNGEAETDFFNCTTFGKQAEFVEKYLKQGTKVLITGRVQNDNYTNKDGQKVYGVQIMVDTIEFAESKRDDGNTAQQGYVAPGQPVAPAPVPQGYAAPGQPAAPAPVPQGYAAPGQPAAPAPAPQGYTGPFPPAPQGYTGPLPPQPQAADGFMNIPAGIDEELPFN